MSDTYLSDKNGGRINPATRDMQHDIEYELVTLNAKIETLLSLLAKDIEEDSGQRLTNAAANTNTICAVEPGTYVFDAIITGGFYFGLADTQVAKNIRWACGVPGRCLIEIPEGKYELHYATTANDGIGYLRRLS